MQRRLARLQAEHVADLFTRVLDELLGIVLGIARGFPRVSGSILGVALIR
jgi:hypothetical protein